MKIKLFLIILILLLFLVKFGGSESESFSIQIFLDKNSYFSGEDVNVLVSFKLNSSPVQNASLNLTLSSEKFKDKAFGHTNEVGEFNYTFKNLDEGKYEIYVNIFFDELNFTNSTNFFVERKKYLELKIGESYYLNETVAILLNGDKKTDFLLEIFSPQNLTIYSLLSSTDEEGIFTSEFHPNEVGTYRILVKWENNSIEKDFEVKEKDVEFNMEMEFTEEGVNFNIHGPKNEDFVLEIENEKNDLVYNLNTGEEGTYNILINLDEGNYTTKIIHENAILIEEFFEFKKIEKLNYSDYEIDTRIEQGIANIGMNVEWKMLITIKNLGDKTFLFDINSIQIPEDATILKIVDSEGNAIDKLEIEAMQSKNLTLFYETPAPIKTESYPIIENNTWKKDVFVSSNSSLPYSNVLVKSEKPKNLKDVRLFLNGEDITNNPSYRVVINDTEIEWNVPLLKEGVFTIYGRVERNERLEGEIFLENVENFVLDCNNEKIEGNFRNNSYGILILNSINITVKNCILSGFEIGIFVKNSSFITLINNTAEKNEQGIVLLNSAHTTLIENTAEKNLYHGIILYSTFDNYIYGNRVRANFDKKILEKLGEMD
ncbi:MAG: NosD domain-containing protein [Candidatus Aenigmatarchaeota archaeon]